MAGRHDDLPFRIELWDDADLRVEEVIAIAADFSTANSAYDEAGSADQASSSRFGRRRG
jgi:hypothetical protein